MWAFIDLLAQPLEHFGAIAGTVFFLMSVSRVWRRGDFAIFDGPITRIGHPWRFHSTLGAIAALLVLLTTFAVTELIVDVYRIWVALQALHLH